MTFRKTASTPSRQQCLVRQVFGKLIEVLATVSIMAKKYTVNLSNEEVEKLRRRSPP
ncbi:hypothetical protein [Nostoc sp. NMS4]|uniref:hypothetical protein n=1 Tax=Nostoc sp. NMS4 TaxID=2815390 RepID=UPI0025CE438C|nr:hypothetical protein [Nostoc sp. NMS4]MBN3925363.1 hypothetical protein [Nostoc sp. NMS4]